MVWRISFASVRRTEVIHQNRESSINTRFSSKKQMEWKRFMNVNKTQIKRSTRKHTTSSTRMLFKFCTDSIYFGGECDEDVVDSDLPPEQQAGQFAFGTDPTAQQQFHFGDDVNM